MTSGHPLGQASRGPARSEAPSAPDGGENPPPLMCWGLVSISAPRPPPVGLWWSGETADPRY